MKGAYTIETIAEQISAGLKFYPGPVWLVDAEGHICFANDSGKQWAFVEEGTLPDTWAEACKKVLESGFPIILEDEEDGKHYSLYFKQGAGDSFVWIFGHDISLFKLSEGALLESTQMFSLILKQAHIGVFMHDLEGRLLMVSGKLFEGHHAQVIQELPFIDSDDHVGRYRNAWEEAVEKGETLVVFGKEEEGRQKYFECELYAVKDEYDHVLGILGLVQDRTDVYVQQQKLLHANRNLREKVYQRTKQVLTLSSSVRENFETTITALHRILELHNPLIGAHTARVAEWSVKIGKKLELSAEELEQLRAAALLHDIGKIYLHSDLLLKSPFSMRPDERVQLQKHPIVGEEVLLLIQGLEEAARAVRYHHELWDGSGYPERLKGTEIPLFSRIISLANAYDKFYHTGYQLQKKDQELVFLRLKSRGKHLFDPELMDVLYAVIQEALANGEVDVEIPMRVLDILPGMVLSRPVLDSRGVLILPAQTTLTARHIEKLKHIFERDRKFCVWVRRIAS